MPQSTKAAGAAHPLPSLSRQRALQPADLHVWLAPLDNQADDAVLSPDERQRAARFVHPHHADRFRAAHAALRHAVSAYAGVPAAALRFAAGPFGKPRLDPPGVAFNLSHSGDWALIALARAAAVGVDIEQPRPIPDHAELARRTFAPAEAAALEALAPDDRLPGFFRCWTRKEAVVKALGTGLSTPLDRFVVPVGTAPGPYAIIGPWSGEITLLPLDLPHGLAGAVAVHGMDGAPVLRRFTLAGRAAACYAPGPCTSSS